MANQEQKATAPYVFDPLVAPKLKAGDPDSVRRFFDKYEEYTEAWAERQEEGTIEEERAPMSVLRCTDRKVRERIKVYELEKTRDHELTNEELVVHLKAKFENVVREVSLQQVLGHIRFDRKQNDPVEKVGRMFQTVDSLLERHGILNRFEEKHVTKFILAAVEPKELKARVDYEVSTKEGKEKVKTLAGLYAMLIEKYQMWYALFPDGKLAAGGLPKKQSVDVNEGSGAAVARQHGAYGARGNSGASARMNGRQDFRTGGRGRGRGARNNDTKRGGAKKCYNCGGPHLQRHCKANTFAMITPAGQGTSAGNARGTESGNQRNQQVARRLLMNSGRQGERTMDNNPRPAPRQRVNAIVQQEEGNHSARVEDQPRATEYNCQLGEGKGQALPVVLNGCIKATYAVDTMASRTCMTTGALQRLQLQAPIEVQTVEDVVFLLGDSSEVRCQQITVMDFIMEAKYGTIELRNVPVYILPGADTGGDILLGEPEQTALGLPTPAEMMDARSAGPVCLLLGPGARTSVDEHSEIVATVQEQDELQGGEGGVEIRHTAEHEEKQEEIEDEETDDEDLPEQGIAGENDPNSAEAMEKAMAAMLMRAENNGASKFVMSELTRLVTSSGMSLDETRLQTYLLWS